MNVKPFFIDSINRVYGTPNEFTINIDDNLPVGTRDIKLGYITLPFSYYVINNNNNTFTMDMGVTPSPFPVSLTNGNYTTSTYITELQSAIDGVISDNTLGVTITASYNSTTSKLEMVGSNDFSVTSDTQNYIYLGLPKSTTLDSTSLNWVSTNSPSINGTRYINITLGNCDLNTSNTNDNNTDLLFQIPVNTNPNGFIQYMEGDFNTWFSMNDTRLKQLKFEMTDEWNNPIDFNGIENDMMILIRKR